MKKTNRRNFVLQGSSLAFAPWIIPTYKAGRQNKDFMHMVFFYLKENTKENRQILIDGLKELSNVKTIKNYNIGIPAMSERDVVVKDYSLSWVTFFDNRAGEASYQIDPIHLKFVDMITPYLDKVVVYDTHSADK